jgi:hypothetical protein
MAVIFPSYWIEINPRKEAKWSTEYDKKTKKRKMCHNKMMHSSIELNNILELIYLTLLSEAFLFL